MVAELLNVLYVQTQGAYLHLEHDTVRVEVDHQTRARLPLLRLQGIVMFGQVSISPFLIHRCAADGRLVVWLTRSGRFAGRLEGPVRGSVLLRRAQHLALGDPERALALARPIVAAKLQNSRQVLLRGARDTKGGSPEALRAAGAGIATLLPQVETAPSLNYLRGIEGMAAREYFGVFGYLVRSDEPEHFGFDGRTRRPPRDRVNAILSFLYALIRGECAGAAEGAGLDPQVGFLHALRPGRPALALDLMEEFRPVVADRLALTLINRRQLRSDHFTTAAGGAVLLTEDGRRTVIEAYQARKEEMVDHRVLGQKVRLGLVPSIQARLFARALRADMPAYVPFTVRM
jgi:CRISPR-associated protein Cas1